MSTLPYQIPLNDFFFCFGESRAIKGVIFFSFSKFWKGVFIKKKIKAVLREMEFKNELPKGKLGRVCSGLLFCSVWICSGLFQTVLVCSGSFLVLFWSVQVCCGLFWSVLVYCFVLFGSVLDCFGLFWSVLGLFWYCSGLFRSIVDRSGLFWTGSVILKTVNYWVLCALRSLGCPSNHPFLPTV